MGIDCGKTRYATKKDALTKINSIFKRGRGRKTRRSKPAALRAYPCPECHGWHLTKQSAYK